MSPTLVLLLLSLNSQVNGSIFLKNRHFIIHERFDKLIYGINTINHLTACKISVCLLFLKWNDFLSYLWINVGNINSKMR